MNHRATTTIPVRRTVIHVSPSDWFAYYLGRGPLQALRGAGYNVASAGPAGPYAEELQREFGIRHEAVAIPRSLSFLADRRALGRLYRLFRRERPAVVHTHTFKAGLLGRIAARLAHVPVVFHTIHGLTIQEQHSRVRRRMMMLGERLGSQCCDTVFSVNHEDIETITALQLCPPQKLHWLGAGVDLDFFRPERFADRAGERAALGIPPEAYVVGYVGRMNAGLKGTLDFLAACALVRGRHAGLAVVIAGEPDRAWHDAVNPTEALSRFGLSECCRYLGQVHPAQMPRVYATLDVLVLPSRFEGMPRAIMEAAAMGVPAIASDVKGNREAVQAGKTGILIPFGDVAALAAAITGLLEDRTRGRDLGQRALLHARRHFDEREIHGRMLHEYERLLSGKHPGSDCPQRHRSRPADRILRPLVRYSR